MCVWKLAEEFVSIRKETAVWIVQVKRARGCVWGGRCGGWHVEGMGYALLLSVVTRLDREVLRWAGVTGSRA